MPCLPRLAAAAGCGPSGERRACSPAPSPPLPLTPALPGLEADLAIVELAALALGSGARLGTIVALPPGKAVTPGAERTHGISTEKANAQGIPFEAAYRQLLELARGELAAAGPGAYLLLIGHNIKSEQLAL